MSGSNAAFIAIDLGATSGRVMLGVLHPAALAVRVELVECGRFPNGPDAHDGGLRWDFEALWSGIVAGLREAASVAAERGLDVRGIGVDSWAVDHGFLDDDGALLARPWCYRDPRTDAVRRRVYARIPFAEHYAINGLQDLPFTSAFQLVAGAESGDVAGVGDTDSEADGSERTGAAVVRETEWTRAAQVLLIPDLVTYRLTGRRVAEATNASTTGLLDARTRTWSDSHIARLVQEFPELGNLRARLPELVEPGAAVGRLLPDIREVTGLAEVPVFAVGSHDTASAVAAAPLPPPRAMTPFPSTTPFPPTTPTRAGAENDLVDRGVVPGAREDDAAGRKQDAARREQDASGREDDAADARKAVAAYISSGTWSLVGLELDEPVLTLASREANFTNELGIDGTVRYLRNVMGLWILNECVREWSEADGEPVDLSALLEDAAREPGGRCLIEVDGEDFLAPGDMVGRVRAAIARQASGSLPPDDTGGAVRLDDVGGAVWLDGTGVRLDTAVHGGGGPDGPERGDGGLDGPPHSGAQGWSVASGSGGVVVPDTRPAIARVILDSLATAYARVVRQAGELAGAQVTAIHVVGGGSQNDLLNRLTAEASGLPVHAGPVEATALGNVLVQARAAGALTAANGGPALLPDLRATVRAGTELHTYKPRGARPESRLHP
ncbi:hypothetical protein GCM10027059_42540 [Myceligenerans halotolerans]